jgi:hypothetical protein
LDGYKQKLIFDEEKTQLMQDLTELGNRYEQLNEDLKLFQESSNELRRMLSLSHTTANQEVYPLALDIQSRPLSKHSSYKGNLDE